MPSLTRSRCALALVVSVGFVLGAVALGATVAAQTARRSQTPLQQATHALLEGHYDEVDALTAPLGPNDPAAAALRGRALGARGRYTDAEAALRTVATRMPASVAALELGLLGKMLGRADATATLTRVATQATDQLVAARALRALGEFKEAHETFRAAASKAPMDPEVNTGWGELFLEAHNNADAMKSFQIALEADPKWAPALLGAALALADDNPPQAVAAAKRALEVNPSFVEAHVFLAHEAMDRDKKDEVREHLQAALAVNPSSLEAHSALAAIAYVEDRKSDFEAEVAKVLAIAPNYGEVYRITAELTSHNYRTDEAAALVRRAVDLQPRDPRALSDLGAQLLRTGDEAGALQALEASYTLDPYDAHTVNMLRLLDTIGKFVTVTDGEFIFRFDKSEADVLREYAIPLAHKALANYEARYEFKAKGPILVEIFPKHDDFAVRNVGMPGMVGALGACFGRVVAMDSPKAKTSGNFQWEATLWHELAHVITIQMSNWRVPRWLTEGISEFEQKRERPEWARQMDLEFAELINEDKVIKLRDLNAAFTDPRKISVAYFQGSVVVDYLLETYGPAGMNKLLRAYGQGLDTTAALKSTLDTDFDQMQAGFDKMLERRFGSFRRALKADDEGLREKSLDELKTLAAADPGSYRIQLMLGRALRKSGDTDGATRALEAAAALVPLASAPHEMMAALALEKKDRPRAIAELQRVVDTDFDNIDAARELAAQMRQAGVDDPAKLRAVNERIVAIDPFDTEAHTVLGRLAMKSNDSAIASREFKVALMLNPVNKAEAHTDLAESYFSLGKKDDAKKQTLAALELAPTYGRAQDLLLKIVEARP